MPNWWETFFDNDYIRFFSGVFSQAQTAEHADGLWQLLNLQEGSRVLDAPCGYGRLARALAERGAIVLGVDQSEILLEKAEKDRGQVPATRLRYIRHDLRKPMEDSGFDAAFNVFSSIGYGTEQDDLAVLQTLRSAVRPGGLVLLEATHRDMVAALRSRGTPPARRLSDGTLIAEESTFDSISGRVYSRWFWWGPDGRGEKSASSVYGNRTRSSHANRRPAFSICAQGIFAGTFQRGRNRHGRETGDSRRARDYCRVIEVRVLCNMRTRQ